jgi:aspartyl-tRNA(Asn)/glutamyl-tRNA(Gln) amidotransferase subunit C
VSVCVEDVKRVAHLARLGVGNDEIDGVCGNLNQILHFVEQLDEVDCSGGMCDIQHARGLSERADVAEPCDPSVMDNAPQKACNMFVVPKVVG